MHYLTARNHHSIQWLDDTLPEAMRFAPAANDSRSIDSLLDAIETLLVSQHLPQKARPEKGRPVANVHTNLDAATVQALLAD